MHRVYILKQKVSVGYCQLLIIYQNSQILCNITLILQKALCEDVE